VDGAGTNRQRVALVAISLAVFLTALDQTVVVTALINIVVDISVPITALDRAAWIISGYLLGYVIAMPLMGRIADIYGRRRVFIVCLLVFALGSLVCALGPLLGAPDSPDTSSAAGLALAPFYWLTQQGLAIAAHVGIDQAYPALNVIVAGRFLQALGGGALVPVALAVVSDLFGPARRGLALGLVGAVAEVGGVLGPVWGAWVTGTWGWRWIFWLNLPIVLLLLVLGAVSLPRTQRRGQRVDVLGAALFGAAVTCLTLGFGAPSSQSSALSLAARSHINPALVIAATLFLLAFTLYELRIRSPVVDLRLFTRRAFSAAAALSLLIGAALIVAMVDIPIFVATVLNRPAVESGLALLRLTALIPVGALAGGWLARRVGCRVPAVTGCALTAVGFWLMHLWPVDVGWLPMTLATGIAGCGFGLVIAPISTSALNAAPSKQSGSASAVITVLRMVGMIVGLSALTAWGLAYFKALVADRALPSQQASESQAAFSARLRDFLAHVVVTAAHQVYTAIFAVAAVLCVLAVVPALWLWRKRLDVSAEPDATSSGAYESYVAPLA
jgi:MFS family permease